MGFILRMPVSIDPAGFRLRWEFGPYARRRDVLGDESDLDAAERWVDGWQAGFAERAAQARELSRRLAELSATARSEDGLVEVIVGSSGLLTGLRLDEGIRGQS